MIGGRILDTTALAAAARGSLYMQALLSIAHQRVIPLLAPSTALSDAYASLKPDAAHALSAILRFPLLTVAALDEADARGAGLLRSNVDTGAGTAAGHVAYLAAARQWPVITGEPDRLRALYPDIELEDLP
ncbi:hypothetical protein [Streptomyces candidus]|uniref:PIN domain-containing protein n=1 Tax=Streptomyces candidus TaxID=67283 RepID=A0A7X0HKM6_9ACTN|nr:hypothetical protein [Streptomyces candidus]MBB6439420.1 hypothetical protein [Streptomyces candidus]GHH54807.1 hypothetical protein GCM10018773_58370 [Streptomyces candidus]